MADGRWHGKAAAEWRLMGRCMAELRLSGDSSYIATLNDIMLDTPVLIYTSGAEPCVDVGG